MRPCPNCKEPLELVKDALPRRTVLFMGDDKPGMPVVFRPAVCTNGHRWEISTPGDTGNSDLWLSGNPPDPADGSKVALWREPSADA